MDKLLKRHQSTLDKLMSEKEEIHVNLTREMDAHHETKRKLSALEIENRNLRQNVGTIPETEGQLQDELVMLKRSHLKEKREWEREKIELRQKLAETPGETPTYSTPRGGEELIELREKLGDGKMSDVYHCLEAGMRCDQIKQLILLDCDLFLSAKYSQLGFHFNEVKILATAAHPPRPKPDITFELKQLDMLVRDIRTLIDLQANLKHVVKCKKAGMFFAEIEDLLKIDVQNLDHASQCRQAGLSLLQIKEIFELRCDMYLPLFGIASCIKSGISFQQVKELSSLGIYLYNAAKLKEEGFSYAQIRDLGRSDRALSVASELRKKNFSFKEIRNLVSRQRESEI